MSRIHRKNMKVSGLSGMAILFVSLLAGVAVAGTPVWEDIHTPFKQTLQFSTAETAFHSRTALCETLIDQGG